MAATSTKSDLKVVILGDEGVGKTCLMNRFVSNHFDEHALHMPGPRRTIGAENILYKDIEFDGQMYNLQIWDTPGQEAFNSSPRLLCRDSHICLLTYSIDQLASFEKLAFWRKKFLDNVEGGQSFSFLVVGNKVDIPEERKVPTDVARAWCLSNENPPLVETSAKDGTNVEHAFMLAVKTWSEQAEKHDRPKMLMSGDTVDLRKQQLKQKKSGCQLS